MKRYFHRAVLAIPCGLFLLLSNFVTSSPARCDELAADPSDTSAADDVPDLGANEDRGQFAEYADKVFGPASAALDLALPDLTSANVVKLISAIATTVVVSRQPNDLSMADEAGKAYIDGMLSETIGAMATAATVAAVPVLLTPPIPFALDFGYTSGADLVVSKLPTRPSTLVQAAAEAAGNPEPLALAIFVFEYRQLLELEDMMRVDDDSD